MSSCVIHFGMLNDIRELYKKDSLDVGIHLVGGCSCSGIRIDAKSELEHKQAIQILQLYLKNKFMFVEQDVNDSCVYHPQTILR